MEQAEKSEPAETAESVSGYYGAASARPFELLKSAAGEA